LRFRSRLASAGVCGDLPNISKEKMLKKIIHEYINDIAQKITFLFLYQGDDK
jgi:hypothetical protein